MVVELSAAQRCPCGSGQPYGECCGPFHRGAALAATPEQLMRSRYSAYALRNEDYLLQSWHISTRPESLELPPEDQWLGLEIVSAPVVAGTQGWVEFSARFRLVGRIEQLHERSRFIYESGRWFYIDGQLHTSAKPDKIGRNALCRCGSGRKYKRCCGVTE